MRQKSNQDIYTVQTSLNLRNIMHTSFICLPALSTFCWQKAKFVWAVKLYFQGCFDILGQEFSDLIKYYCIAFTVTTCGLEQLVMAMSNSTLAIKLVECKRLYHQERMSEKEPSFVIEPCYQPIRFCSSQTVIYVDTTYFHRDS